MARYTNYDKLINKWYNLGFEEASRIHKVNAINHFIKNLPIVDVVEIPKSGIGDLSDGYHTFNELYHHRAVLFSVICNLMPDKAWKSKLHDTGDMFDGMFIVGVETPEGQATYHYDIEPYWDMFKVKELEKAPKWDGHTPSDAINRIENLSADYAEVRHSRWENISGFDVCNICGTSPADWETKPNNPKGCPPYCHCCGAKMDGNNQSTIPTGSE